MDSYKVVDNGRQIAEGRTLVIGQYKTFDAAHRAMDYNNASYAPAEGKTERFSMALLQAGESFHGPMTALQAEDACDRLEGLGFVACTWQFEAVISVSERTERGDDFTTVLRSLSDVAMLIRSR